MTGGLDLAPVAKQCPISREMCTFYGNVATGAAVLGVTLEEVERDCAMLHGERRQAGEPCPPEQLQVRLRQGGEQ